MASRLATEARYAGYRAAALQGAEKAVAAAMARRLAGLKAADMPWLAKEGLAALAAAPEPPSYKKPAGWR